MLYAQEILGGKMPSKFNPKICEGCEKEVDFKCTVYLNPWKVAANYQGGPCPFNPPKAKASVKRIRAGQQKTKRNRG